MAHPMMHENLMLIATSKATTDFTNFINDFCEICVICGGYFRNRI